MLSKISECRRSEDAAMSNDGADASLASRVKCLKERIVACLPLAPGPATLGLIPVRARSVHEIAILEVRRPTGNARYFIKASVPGYAGKQDLEIEAQLLAQWGPSIAALNPRTRCPQLLAFFPADKLLLMEYIDGVPLKSMLFNLPFSYGLQRLLTLSGEWLGSFHRQSQEGQANPFDWLWEAMNSEIMERTFGPISTLYTEAIGLLKTFRDRHPQFQRPLCQIHGEFTPLHILVQQDAIYVVDFGSSRRGFAYEDLALFSTFYDGLMPWRRLTSLRYPFARQNRSFLNSYNAHCGRPLDGTDEVVASFARMLAMARHRMSWDRAPRRLSENLTFRIRRSWMSSQLASVTLREIHFLQQIASSGMPKAEHPIRLGAGVHDSLN